MNINEFYDNGKYKNFPLLLLNDNNCYFEEYPHVFGIEFEYYTPKKYHKYFAAIPQILHTNNTESELRLKFEYGINGAIQLYLTTILIKMFSEVSPIGHHINIDGLNKKHYNLLAPYNNYILNTLDILNYTGKYNLRKFNSFKGGWLCCRENRLECRISQASVEYDVIMHDVTLLNKLCVYLRTKIDVEYNQNKDNYKKITKEVVDDFFNWMQKELALDKEKIVIPPIVKVTKKQIINKNNVKPIIETSLIKHTARKMI